MAKGYVLLAVSVMAVLASTARAADEPSTPAATRGREIYRQACSSCHGQALQGGEHAPTLRGAGFVANWKDAPARRLFGQTLSTMPANAPGSLSREDVLAVTAYLLEINTGQKVDPKSADDLNGVIIGPAGPP